MGHVGLPGRPQLCARTPDAIKKAKTHTTQTDLLSLRMCNVFDRFVFILFRIAMPLNRLLEKDRPTWISILTEEEYHALDTLLTRLIGPLTLVLPKRQGRMVFNTEACQYQLGWELLQDHPEGGLQPRGYWSRRLSEVERDIAHRNANASLSNG